MYLPGIFILSGFYGGLILILEVVMETVRYFLEGTPWWVYLIFVYLVFIGIKSVKGGGNTY